MKHDAGNAKKAADIKAIEDKLKGVDITGRQGTDSIAEVIARLKKAGATVPEIIKAIKDITGGTVDLGAGHPDTKITDIDLTPGKKDGEISVAIKTTTKDATPPAGNAHGTLQGNKKAVVTKTKQKDADLKDLAKRLKDVNIKTKQGTKTVKDIKDIIDKMKKDGKSIKDILAKIKEITGVDLGSGHPDTKITGVELKTDPKTGDISVTVTTKTKGAKPEAGTVKGTMKGNPDATVKASIDRDGHAADIKKKIDGIDIKKGQGTKTIKDIIDAINAAKKKPGATIKDIIKAVKDATGVDLGTGQVGTNNPTNITGINVKPGKTPGTIDIDVITKTPGADPADKTVTGKLIGNPADVVAANNNKPVNIKKITAAFNNAKLAKQGTRTIKQVIADIMKAGKGNVDNILKAIANETNGTQIASVINGTTITKIDLAVNTAGDGIDVTITTNTPKATNPDQTIKVKISGDSQATVAKRIADALQKDNAKKIADIIGKGNIGSKQGDKTTGEIIADIKADAKKRGGTLPDLIAAIKAATGIDLSKGHKGTDITGIKLTSKPDGTLGIDVDTRTTGATDPTGTDGKVHGSTKGKTDKEVANDKAKAAYDRFQKLFKTAKLIDQRNRKSSDVIKEIEALPTLEAKLKAIEKETGIHIDEVSNGTTIKSIKLTLGINKKDISVVIKIVTTAGSETVNTDISISIAAKSNKQIANETQKRNIDRIIKNFRRASLIKQGKRKIDDVISDIMNAGTIQDKIQKIKDETGIDLGQGLESPTTIKDVVLTKKADGTIKMIVTTNTPDADTEVKPVDAGILGEADAIIAKVIEKAKADVAQPENIKKIEDLI
ncbi:MAG: hypothetical protein GY793_00870, partial [Proteobacteria bacterium]|nr:hypothetical protein [Pseudomonadota bacterium]